MPDETDTTRPPVAGSSGQALRVAPPAPPGVAEVRQDLMHRIRQGSRALSLLTQAYVSVVARRARLTTAEVHAAGVLRHANEENSPVSPGDVADSIALTPAAVSAVLDRMEEHGHLERRRNPHDGRRQDLLLTASALETSDDLFEALVAAYDEALVNVPLHDLEVLATLLEALGTATVTATARHQSGGQHRLD